MKSPTYPDNKSENHCSWCGKGFMVALPSMFVPLTQTFHTICAMCLRHGYSNKQELRKVRRIVRILCFNDQPGEQGVLT